MFARKAVISSIGRATVMATVAAMALAVVGPSAARAGGATDFSSRARVYHHGGGGAAAAAFAGIVGTGLAIAAAQNRHAYYDDYDAYGGPAYGGGPVYVDPGYSGGYGYYGGGPAYFDGHRDYYHDYRYR